ncbi:hypothetical protein V6U90_21700 [Micromonospora sp. CPCC 206060]|uniref:hypothetical protein n=1 Tax=Micromonospora sp. CPCC 206060 TaxID=3122406 RepID=UPI002FF0E570
MDYRLSLGEGNARITGRSASVDGRVPLERLLTAAAGTAADHRRRCGGVGTRHRVTHRVPAR